MTLPPTKREQVAEALRRRILAGDLVRDSRLRQDELARALSTSITPVREALRILESEGLVVSEPHKGVRVAGLDIERTKATYVVRRLVETYAMRRATLRMTRLDIKNAWSLVEQMRLALDQSDSQTFGALNRGFHFTFYERCGMPALCAHIEAMWRGFPWDLSLDSIDRDEKSHEEHVLILEAVESGDLDKVAIATETHLAEGFMSILRRITGSDQPDPFLIDVDAEDLYLH